ncbi:MAG: hypothetical protein V4550_02745 [Gemmatimonadota bacterium]
MLMRVAGQYAWFDREVGEEGAVMGQRGVIQRASVRNANDECLGGLKSKTLAELPVNLVTERRWQRTDNGVRWIERGE